MADRFELLLFRTVWIGCLLGAVATLYFLAGLAGYVGNPLVNIAVAVCLGVAAVFFLYCFFFILPKRNKLAITVWLFLLLILAVEILLGLVPPTARDELTHHLVIPRLYVQAGRIIEVPFAPYSYYPMLLDMLYAPWVQWKWDSVPKLVHGLFGWLAGLLLYAYLARRLSPIYGLLGFFFFVSLPAVLRLSTWAYVDLGVVFYSTASLLCALRWLEEKKGSRWLALAGLTAGFAFATKPNGLVAAFVLALLLLFTCARVTRPIRTMAVVFCIYGAAALLPALPWLIKNWFQTGNPLFPFLTGLFAGQGGGGINIRPTELGVFAKRALLYGESGWEIAALPLRVFFFGKDDNPQYFDGVLSPLLILFLPWAFKGKWPGEKKLFLTFALLYFAYALFLVDLRIRYILLIVPSLVILMAYGIHNIYLRIARPTYLIAAVLFFFALNGVYLWRYFQEVSPLAYALGRESRDAYLTRKLAEYPAIQYVNQELPADAKIYFLFIGRRAYYCERSYFHDGGELPWRLVGLIRSARNGGHVRRELKKMGLTHMLIREDLFSRFLRDNLASTDLETWDRFATRHLRGLYRSRGYAVYQIHD